jgi:hypothetical protein
MSVQGWLKAEPYEPEFVVPEWLRSAFEVATKRFQLTPSALCEKLHLTPEAFTAITGIPTETVEPLRFRPRLVVRATRAECIGSHSPKISERCRVAVTRPRPPNARSVRGDCMRTVRQSLDALIDGGDVPLATFIRAHGHIFQTTANPVCPCCVLAVATSWRTPARARVGGLSTSSLSAPDFCTSAPRIGIEKKPG